MGQGFGHLQGAREVDYRGARFALGRTSDAYAIWDLAGGPPVRTFPLTDEAWPEAWLTYQAWEAGTPSPTGETPKPTTGQTPPVGQQAQQPATAVMDYPGARHGLGRAEGKYFIWDLEARTALESFPVTPEGWRDAWLRFQDLERPYASVPPRLWEKGRPIPIRAMRAGQIVGGTFKLYFMHFWVLIGLIAVVLVPVELVSGALTITTLETVTVDTGFGAMETVQNPVWVTIVNAILFFLAIPFVTASVLAAIAEAFLGRRVTLGSAYRAGFRRALPVLWVSVLFVLVMLALFLPAILVGAIAFLTDSESPAFAVVIFLLFLAAIPFAILLSVRFLFGTSTVVMEAHRGVGALRRSWQLVRGLGWKVLGNFLLIGLVQAGISLVVVLVGLAVASALFLGDVLTTAGGVSVEAFRGFLIFSTLFNAVVTVLLTPFSSLAIVLLYFDTRVRKERFSEEVLAREFGAAFPQVAARAYRGPAAGGQGPQPGP